MKYLLMTCVAAVALAGCTSDRQECAKAAGDGAPALPSSSCSAADSAGVKISEKFGYDPADSTRFLQAALDSGERKIILDRQSGPWVTLPLKARSNQEIVFEPGVELVAKRGEFKGIRDYLFEAKGCTNLVIRGGEGSTMRMWKKDYQGPDYKHGEWRYALRIVNCRNVLVENMRFVDSGGDGIGVSGDDITIRRCVCDRNHRQGISVFSVKNLLIEDTVLSNTDGTAPMAGIDFEPDLKEESLQNVVMRNCRSFNNSGSGYEFYFGAQDGAVTKPMSITIEGCTSENNKREVTIASGPRVKNYVKGFIKFKDCRFGNTKGADKPAISVQESFLGYHASFENCVGGEHAIYSHPVIDHVIKAANGRELPVRGCDVPANPVVVDKKPGQAVDLQPNTFVYGARFLFYVEKPGKATFTARQVISVPGRKLGVKKYEVSPVNVDGTVGKVLKRLDPAGKEPTELVFEAPRAGFYQLEVKDDSTRFQLLRTTVPVAVRFKGSGQHFAARGKPFSVWFTNVGKPQVLAAGGDNYYRFQARSFAPDGRQVDHSAMVTDGFVCWPGANDQQGLWRVEFSAAKEPNYDWVRIDTLGGSGVVFLTPEKYWKDGKASNSAAGTVPFSPGSAGVKISEKFGYDPVDSTAFLQKALDSGEPKLILDRKSGPWYTLPLKMRSNTELVIEPGVELVAKRGEYKGLRDYLLELPYATNVTIRGGAGSTLRMWKKDYQGPDYKHGEWRYALRIFHCQNVLVEGVRMVESGGDGIGITGKDIVIRNCVCDRNHRQGISLFNAENLLIEDCVLSNTSGTAPQSGIDIEPDRNNEQLRNVVLRNVTASGNAGCGFELYLNNLDDTCKPIDIRFENCRAVGNSDSARVNGGGKRTAHFVKGRVAFDNCLFESPRHAGIVVLASVPGGYDVAFRNCTVTNAPKDVAIGANVLAQGNPDGIAFENLKIYQPEAREWFSCSRAGVGPRAERITGNVEVIGPDGGRKRVVLDEAWRKANLPLFNGGRPLPPRAVLPDAAKVAICDEKPGELVALQPLSLLYGSRVVFFMEKPGKARFTARQINVVKGRDNAKKPLTMTFVRPDGKKGRSWKLPIPGTKETAFEFDAPKAGFYRMEGVSEGTRFQLMKSSVPVAVSFLEKAHMTSQIGGKPFSLWLDVPGGAPWAVFAAGDDYYRFKLKVVDPAGKLFVAQDLVETPYVVNGEAAAPAGIYRLDISRAAKAHYEWVNFDVYGAPPYMFLCREKRWSVR